MDKMEILQGVIEENIEWFWGNDSIVSYETDMSKLWNAFEVWCVQNCKEIFDNLKESIIKKAVDRSYNDWVNKKIF